jgi:hypothetical protein
MTTLANLADTCHATIALKQSSLVIPNTGACFASTSITAFKAFDSMFVDFPIVGAKGLLLTLQVECCPKGKSGYVNATDPSTGTRCVFHGCGNITEEHVFDVVESCLYDGEVDMKGRHKSWKWSTRKEKPVCRCKACHPQSHSRSCSNAVINIVTRKHPRFCVANPSIQVPWQQQLCSRH